MLKYRILTALILIPVLIALILTLPPVAFCILTGVIVLWGALEWSFFMGVNKFPHCLIYPVIMLFLLFVALELPIIYTLYVSIVWWLFALFLVVRYPNGNAFWSKRIWVRGLMGVMALVPCWLALNFLRNTNEGPYIILFLFVIIWGADTGAYFIGKKWGKHKLAPQVSPGKTWQGFFGAFLVTLIISGGTFYFLNIPQPIWIPVTLVSLVTVAFSIVGDLFESMMKRNVGLKDSGHLLPGHGGLLDRIDSLTAAAPVFAVGEIILGNFFQ